MAWVFVRLKWRLLVNTPGSGMDRALAWIARIVGLSIALAGASSLAGAPRHGGAGLVAIFTALLVGWVMLPLLAGSYQAIDATRLAPLPLRRRQLATGLFAASWVGAPPIATAIFLAGAVVAYAGGLLGTAIAVADAAVMTVLAIVAARAVGTALAAATHSRRGRDAATVIFAVVSAGGYITWRLAAALARRADSLEPSPATTALSWTPPGALARSMVDAHAGHPAAAAARLAYGVAATAAVGWLWARALDRQLTNPALSGGGRRHAQGEVAQPVRFPGRPVRAVAWKDLIYLWRAPVQRARVIAGVVTAAVVALPLLTGRHASATAPYVGAAVAGFVAANLATNAFGVDREAFAGYVLAGSDPADLVRGKGLAVGGVVGVVAALAALAGAAFAGGWGELPAALFMTAAAAGIGVGGGLVHSVLSPFPVNIATPALGRQRRPRGRGTPGVGLLVFAAELAAGGLAVGLLFAGRALFGAGSLPGAVLAALLAALALALALRFAARRLAVRLPEVLAALSPRG